MLTRVALVIAVSLALNGNNFGASAFPQDNEIIPPQELYAVLDSFHPEVSCLKRGGVCGLGSACPPNFQFEEKGLCPKQKDLGAECCKMVPTNIKDCSLRGGECVTQKVCGRSPKENYGVCPTPGHVCCMFTRESS